MRILKFVLAAIAALSMSGVANATDWKPVGPWAADYGDDYCRLARFFTNGKDQVAFIMERTQPGQFFRVVMVGDSVKLFRTAASVAVQFSPQAPHNAMVLRTKVGDGQQYLDFGLNSVMPMPAPGAPPVFKPYNAKEERDAAKPVNAVSLTTGLVDPMTFQTGALDAPIGALQTCTSDLIAQWGVDAKKYETVSKPAFPAGKVSDWVPAQVFPFTEFAKFSGGMNVFRVMVDAEGKPTSCVVQRPSADPAHNKSACDGIMKNGKFTPALDSAGQPMAGFWITETFGLLPPPPGAGGRR